MVQEGGGAEMKKSFSSYLAVLFVTSVIFLLWRMLSPGQNDVRLVKKELSKGKIIRNVTTGIEHIQVLKKKYNKELKLTRRENEIAYKLQDSTKDYNLDMIIEPQEDSGLIKLDYRIEVKSKKLMRIDTVSLFRIDTLKIEKVKVRENPFYDSFWFGSAITTLVIFLFSLLIK
jgi:hypothetical protein